MMRETNYKGGFGEVGVSSSRFTYVSGLTGTFFENNVDPLTHNVSTFAWRTSTLPDNTNTSIYQFPQEGNDHTTVARIPEGKGKIVFLAWDWFDSQPVGSQDNGWIAMLESGMFECLRS